MNGIFINNYRGFTDTYFPLKNVNFFVGENSSGKTSLLKAINFILSPVNFLTQAEDIQNKLGAFSDIYSGTKNGYVELGANCSYETKEVFYITKIHNSGDIPYIVEFLIYHNGDLIVFYKPQRGYVKYFHEKNVQIDVKSPIEIFKKLVSFRKTVEDRGSAFVDIPKAFKEKITLPMVFSKINECNSVLFHVLLDSNVLEIAPIRSCPQKTYDKFLTERTPDGKHVPYLLSKLLLSKMKQNEKVIKSIEKYGKDSGLFNRLGIHSYGKNGNAPFAITVNMDAERSIDNVGYGVSQILPILTDIFLLGNGKKHIFYTIQQPEIHLHPRAQASLGDVFFQEAIRSNNFFCIETHSDYIIDRFRMAFKQTPVPEDFSQILFFEHRNKQNYVTTIDILADGNYTETQPTAFREFFFEEQIKLLSL